MTPKLPDSGNYPSEFFGLKKVQLEDVSISNDSADKLMSTTKYPILYERRKKCEQTMNEIERFAFASTNRSLP